MHITIQKAKAVSHSSCLSSPDKRQAYERLKHRGRAAHKRSMWLMRHPGYLRHGRHTSHNNNKGYHLFSHVPNHSHVNTTWTQLRHILGRGLTWAEALRSRRRSYDQAKTLAKTKGRNQVAKGHHNQHNGTWLLQVLQQWNKDKNSDHRTDWFNKHWEERWGSKCAVWLPESMCENGHVTCANGNVSDQNQNLSCKNGNLSCINGNAREIKMKLSTGLGFEIPIMMEISRKILWEYDGVHNRNILRI